MMPSSSVCFLPLFFLLSFGTLIEGVQRTGRLGQLQVGIMKRVNEADCSSRVKIKDEVDVNYVGKLYNEGTEFDSNIGKAPFRVTVGVGQVIRGWDKGLIGMCVGEKRRLMIPAEDAYGAAGSPPKIPPNSDLLFDVELLEIVKPKTDL